MDLEEDWFQPNTYSVWAYSPRLADETDAEMLQKPLFLVLFEWEIAGLRGVALSGAWGDLHDLAKPQTEWHTHYGSLIEELCVPEQMTSLQLAELIALGQLQRLGEMPKWGEFKEPARDCLPPSERTTSSETPS
jgi:hypothetical protein